MAALRRETIHEHQCIPLKKLVDVGTVIAQSIRYIDDNLWFSLRELLRVRRQCNVGVLWLASLHGTHPKQHVECGLFLVSRGRHTTQHPSKQYNILQEPIRRTIQAFVRMI